MKVLLLHMPTAAGTPKQLAVNADEILRMEEVEGTTLTQIIQMDKGPTTVEESLGDILKAAGADVMEVEKPQPKAEEVALHGGAAKHGQPIGAAHVRAGAR